MVAEEQLHGTPSYIYTTLQLLKAAIHTNLMKSPLIHFIVGSCTFWSTSYSFAYASSIDVVYLTSCNICCTDLASKSTLSLSLSLLMLWWFLSALRCHPTSFSFKSQRDKNNLYRPCCFPSPFLDVKRGSH
jgi:hypothetical protein